MKKIALLILLLSTISWVSCGGGGGGGGVTPPPPAVSITVTPGNATVGAGGTVLFTATVANNSNTGVTWQVEGIAGGDATVGTISTSGLYTAPLAIPAGGSVTVAAVAKADTSKSDASEVTVVHSPAMLSGHYAFSYVGYNPYYFIIAGEFVADGNGTITSGHADLNTYDVFPAMTLTGTYSMETDGRVEIDLTDSLGNDYTLRAVVISPSRLRMIQFDSPTTALTQGATGQGVIDKQDTSAFNDAAFAGGYAFRFDGPGFGACTAGIAGRMTADGAGNLTDGVMDVNDACAGDINADPFTGTYSIAASGRGEATLNTSQGVATFAFYMVSAGKAHFVSLDYWPWMLGVAEKQTLGTFSNANVTGGYAYFVSGYSTTGIYYNAGRFTANGSGAVSAGVSDENDGGVTTENLAFTGTYSVDASGRGSASLTSSRGTSDFSFYMVSPARALFVQQGALAVATGEIDGQSGTFTPASFTGHYGQSMDGDPSMMVGQFAATGTGSASGIVDINTWDDVNKVYVPTADQVFTATYSVTSNGRVDFAVPDTTTSSLYHIYMVSGSKVIVIGMTDMALGAAEKQF